MIPYSIKIEDIPQPTSKITDTPFVDVKSHEFAYFQNFHHQNITCRTYPTIGMSYPERNAPYGMAVASTSRSIVKVLKLTIPSATLSLPTCLIPTRIVGINKTSNATFVGGMGSLSLFSQCFSIPFNFGMPPWKLLATWGRPEFNCDFAAKNPLDHRPFRKQATEQPAVSPKVTMGGADSNVHTAWDGGPNINLIL